MLHVETEKLSIHVRKKSQDLAFFVGKGRLAAPLLGYSRQRVHTTLSKTKCQEKTVRTRHPYSIKPKNIFSASKNFWLWDFLSQHPYWIFLLFVCSNTLWRLVKSSAFKTSHAEGHFFTYHVKTWHPVWLSLVHARIRGFSHCGSPKATFRTGPWVWENLLPKAKWDFYAWSRQHCIFFATF